MSGSNERFRSLASDILNYLTSRLGRDAAGQELQIVWRGPTARFSCSTADVGSAAPYGGDQPGGVGTWNPPD
jgi:hypothetical protein